MHTPFLPASFTLDRALATGRKQTVEVTLTTRPPCPSCGPHERIHSRGFLSDAPLEILDLPRTHPIELRVRRRRFECLVCNAAAGTRRTFSERGPDTHHRYNMTNRLWRHVRDAVTKKPLLQVEKETGVPYSTLRDIAVDLATQLESNHRFPTPAVLGMDGLKLYRKEYMVVGDAETGIPIGFLPTIIASDVRGWVDEHVDLRAVRVFVADLHKSNTSVAGLRFGSAIHVADKWHVFERYQRALSQVVNQKIDQLRKSGESAKARTLWDLKPAIMAVDPNKQKWRRYPKKAQRTFDFANDLKPVLDHPDNDPVRRAFWGRHDFLRFYASRTLADAMPHLDRCRDLLVPLANVEKVKTFWNHLNSNWPLISNYFETVQLRQSGKWRGATTNAIEQRNREIRKLADVRNGVQNFGLLRLLVLYHKWHIGDEIVFCSERDCSAVWGPVFGPPVPPEIRQASGIHPRCPDHL